MIKWFKRNQDDKETKTSETSSVKPEEGSASSVPIIAEEPAITPPLERKGIFGRFKAGLTKTRHHLGDGIGRLLLGKKEIDADLLDDLETMLLTADVGIETTQAIIEKLSDGLARKQLADGDAVFAALKVHLQTVLMRSSEPLTLKAEEEGPFVILMVGVNGAGKTTTIGKLAKQFQQQGKKVMLAAGDTFRAAAIEQLEAWGERNKIPVIAQHSGADSASVVYDALQAAKARNYDVLIADTAGRLHTQQNLMDELKKIKRVLTKLDPNAPHETMLVLDATIGQNALNQARQFKEAVGVTGIAITKLDGTAKGGILFAIANELDIPFRYIGIGEGIDDLRPFDAAYFVDAIFNDDRI
ncbi:signal recognition particle-docking protein FtsY [Legionella yabuuchiae]|uniref:signal recognition particle-docking protein FtsY n=1 Tax=Legionella yabuuchiae TaxID=376727 RepID=UPI00105561AB|nr:signal recognition particle-docking protein FtsY [Legionella yabuuchiae]